MLALVALRLALILASGPCVELATGGDSIGCRVPSAQAVLIRERLSSGDDGLNIKL